MSLNRAKMADLVARLDEVEALAKPLVGLGQWKVTSHTVYDDEGHLARCETPRIADFIAAMGADRASALVARDRRMLARHTTCDCQYGFTVCDETAEAAEAWGVGGDAAKGSSRCRVGQGGAGGSSSVNLDDSRRQEER